MPSPLQRPPPKYACMKRLALALPGTVEESHRHGPWFNVGKKTFALYWGKSERWILRLPQHQVMMLIDARPEVFAPMKSGSLLWIYLDVRKMTVGEMRDYVTAAWRHTAPKKLQAAWPGGRQVSGGRTLVAAEGFEPPTKGL
jgi:hypothetical protein